MHTCIKYEGSIINHMGRTGGYRKKEKWLPLKNIGFVDKKVYAHVPWTYVHISVRCKVSMIQEDCP